MLEGGQEGELGKGEKKNVRGERNGGGEGSGKVRKEAGEHQQQSKGARS